MKKKCGLIIFTVLFFTLKSFGGNRLSFPLENKLQSSPLVSPADTAKKIANSDTTDEDDDTVRSFAFGISYGSDQSYHGIHSNVKLPYIEPNFTYTAPKGFYVEVSAQDILVKKAGGFDALDLTPGWNIDLADNTTLNFNLSHYIFRAGTPATIRSDLSDAVETYLDQWIGETEGKFTVDYDYYKKTSKVRTPGDIILSPDLAHTFKFKFKHKSSLSLVPEGSVDFGTRNAYTHYEANIGDSIKSQQQGKKSQIPSNTSFGTLDYNFVFTIDYKIGRFEIEPAVNYTAPLYIAQGVSSKPLGYLTLDLTYTIDKKVSKVPPPHKT
jgi:hypothetical protein